MPAQGAWHNASQRTLLSNHKAAFSLQIRRQTIRRCTVGSRS